MILPMIVFSLLLAITGNQADGPSLPGPEVPKFDCRNVPFPTEAGSYSSANPTPLHAVFLDARRRGFKDGIARITLQFDDTGSVVSAKIAQSSGDKDLDRASLNWAFCTRIKPGKPARATIPVAFQW